MRAAKTRIVAVVAILSAAALLAYTVTLSVPAGSIGVEAGGKEASGDVLRPGIHFRNPFARVVLLPAGEVDYSGEVETTSAEGAAVRVPYEARIDFAKGDPAGLAAIGQRFGAGMPLEAAVGAVVGEVLRGLPANDASRLAAETGLLGIGIVPGSLRLGPSRTRTAENEHPLLAAYPGPPRPVLVVGIDSADWDLIDPLIEAGRLPHLAALRGRGAWGPLRSMTPTLSPILWTTIATGRPPEEHGIIDFLMKDPATGAEVPISRLFRRVKALWNIASDLGVPNMTVGWWATWPAEKVEGHMVTDRVAYSLFDLALDQEQPGNTWPESFAREVARLRVAEEEIRYEEVADIVSVSRSAFDRSRLALETPEGYADPVSHLIKVIAASRTYHDIALELLRSRAPSLSLVYFEGLDEVNHRFAHYMPPAMGMVAGVPRSSRESFADAVLNFYAFQDSLLGDLIEAAGPEAVVVVISDHGFANGAERPVDVPPDIEGKPGLWHRMDGVLIIAGPPIRPGRLEGPVGLLDVTPTLLALMGLPPAEDMPGRAIPGLFRDGEEPALPPVRVASYDQMGEPLASVNHGGPSAQDQEMIAKMTALGYIQAGAGPGGVPGAGEVTATYHINAGHLMLRKRDFDRAEQEFRSARDLAPRFDQPYLGLAQVEVMRGRPASAIPYLEQIFLLGDEPQPALLTRAARVYASAGREREGIAFLGSLHYEGRREAFRRAATGMLWQSAGDRAASLEEYRAALSLDPSVEVALQGVYDQMKEGPLDDLAGLLEPSLRVESRRVAVRAANWLALVRERQGRRPEAREILKQAAAQDPGDLMTLTNLGSMLVRDDLAGEGLPWLEKAHDLHPRSFEVIVNLVVGYAKNGDLDRARRVFEEGKEIARRPDARLLYNAMAYGCFLNGKLDEARARLEESLAIEPGQPEALRLLEEIARAAAG